MFDKMKNMGGMLEMMKNAGAIKDKMKAMQEELGRQSFEADAGAGRVTAQVSGKMLLERVRIDKERIDMSNTELLEDLIVAAVNAAQAKAAMALKDGMDKMAKDMNLPPGLLGG